MVLVSALAVVGVVPFKASGDALGSQDFFERLVVVVVRRWRGSFPTGFLVVVAGAIAALSMR